MSPSNFRNQSLPDLRGDLDPDRQEIRKTDPSSPHDGTSGQNGLRSDAGNSGDLPATDGGASELPDVSAEFQNEMAAIRGYYAARIAAARRSLSAGDLAAAIKALLNEETVAVRALSDRRLAATQRQQQEKPKRPTGSAPSKNEPKLP